jgi:hypothetical protein
LIIHVGKEICVKKHRRIEITAFRRVTVVAGERVAGSEIVDLHVINTNGRGTIGSGSAEGQKLLAEAIGLLKRRLDERNEEDQNEDGRPRTSGEGLL